MSVPLFGKMSKATHIEGKIGIRPLTAPEKSVLWALSDDHGRLGEFAELSVAELVLRTRWKKRQVQYALRSLEADGGIRTDRPYHQGSQQVTRYHINADAFCEVKELGKGCTSCTHKGAPHAQKGAPAAPITIASKPPSTPPSNSVSSVSSEKEVKALASERANERARTREKTRAKSSDEAQRIEGLLMVRLKHVDHRLAAGILRDCRASNPEVRLEEILVVLTRIVLRGIPAHIKNPNGWLRAEAAGAVRKEYLAALDRRGAALMAAAGRVKQ